MTARGEGFLVTGGAGLVSSHVCEALLATGADVVCVDDFKEVNR